MDPKRKLTKQDVARTIVLLAAASGMTVAAAILLHRNAQLKDSIFKMNVVANEAGVIEQLIEAQERLYPVT